MDVPVLLYHSIAPFELSGIWITKRRFEKQIEWLFKNGFGSLNPEQLSNSTFKKSIMITFDDAYDNLYEEGIPVLLKYGFTAIIFVLSGYVGKENSWDAGVTRRTHMGWDRLRELSSLNFEIASHTHTHPDLTKLSRDKVKREMEFSKKLIEDKIGKPVKFLSYPFGRHSKLVRECARESGYTACFSSNPFSKDRWAIGRMGIYIIDTMAEYKVKLYPAKNSPFYNLEGIKNNAINFVARGTPIWKSIRRHQ